MKANGSSIETEARLSWGCDTVSFPAEGGSRRRRGFFLDSAMKVFASQLGSGSLVRLATDDSGIYQKNLLMTLYMRSNTNSTLSLDAGSSSCRGGKG